MKKISINLNNYKLKTNFKMETKKQTLSQFLEDFLSNYDYCMLDKILEITETKKSRLLAGTDQWEFIHFSKLFNYLVEKDKYKLPKSIEEILEKCEFKTNVTIIEAIEINKILKLCLKN